MSSYCGLFFTGKYDVLKLTKMSKIGYTGRQIERPVLAKEPVQVPLEDGITELSDLKQVR